MAKVTRIAYSKQLNKGKRAKLDDIASRLGKVRADLWRRYGSVSGVGLKYGQVAQERKGDQHKYGLTYKLWKNTLKDTIEDIAAYRAAVKVKVRQAIWQRTKDAEERKRLFTLLKSDRWMEDPYLRRKMRKVYKHGKTSVSNQIVLEPIMYTTFLHGGICWLKVQSLERGKRIAIPLTTNREPKGTLRLILKPKSVEVHHTIEREASRPCGERVIGVDKGYTEAFTDSDGDTHGEGLGILLSSESDYLKVKYQRRNKLTAIAEAKPHKRANIERFNLGRQTLDRRKAKHTKRVRDVAFKAAHGIVDKANTIAAEDLTSPIKSRNFGKNQNRRLSGWVKGTLAEALQTVSKARGSSLKHVSCAYTSQMDNRHGILFGRRSGQKFYCFDGEVLDADRNAALNILARLDDHEIHVFTPYREVKNILLERTAQFKRDQTVDPRHQLQAA